MFMLDTDERTPSVYLNGESLDGRVMIPRAGAGDLVKPWAVVAKTAPGSFHDAAMVRRFLVSDNVCLAGDKATDCTAKLETVRVRGTHLLMDNLEGGESAQRNGDYFVNFTDGFAANCNPFSGLSQCLSAEIDGYYGLIDRSWLGPGTELSVSGFLLRLDCST